MTPNFEISADSQNITRVIQSRLLSLTVVDEAGWQSDTLEIRLDDRDRGLEWPRHGAELIVHLGYQETGLLRMGVFTVDEVSFEGAPDTLIIKARAANFRNSLKEQKTRAWEAITISDLVTTIAKEHELEPVVSTTLADKLINHIDQTGESDLHFLTRLSKDYGAIAKPSENKLLFVPKGEARTATGKTMNSVSLTRQDLQRYSFALADRDKYQAVIAHWHDNSKGETHPVKVGDPEAKPIFTLKGLHPDADAAKAAAAAKLKSLKRGTGTGNLSLAGRPDITAETRLTLTGIKDKANGDWIVTRAEHQFSRAGLATRLSIETPNK